MLPMLSLQERKKINREFGLNISPLSIKKITNGGGLFKVQVSEKIN